MKSYEYNQNRKCSECDRTIKDRNKSGYCSAHLGLLHQKHPPSYSSVHIWLSYHYTKSQICSHCNLKTKTEWALKKGFDYERKIENFTELCKRCHILYDFTEETRKKMSLSQSLMKRPWMTKKVIRIDENGKEKLYQSIAEAIEENNISRGHLWKAIKDYKGNKKAANYYWKYG